MPKCGSSALQTYLSSSDFERVTKGRCVYLALKDDGRVLSGETLLRRAQMSPYGYTTSAQANALAALDTRQKTDVRASLYRLGEKHDWLILSSEAWGPTAQHFTDECLFADPAFEIHVLGYVRPQVEWINSAWWQWGAWTQLKPRQWIDRERKKALWYSLFHQWSAKTWIKSLNVRLLNDDIVQDFMSHLGYQVSNQSRINQSLPAIVLRLFQRHRHLRPDPHASAIEFVLARHLHLNTKKTPWIMGTAITSKLIDFFREDNEKLAQMLSPQQREHLISDPRWWQAEYYQQRSIEKAFVDRIDVDELERFAVAAIETINDIELELRELRARSISF